MSIMSIEPVEVYCFRWCGKSDCFCCQRLNSMLGMKEIPIFEKSYVNMKQDEKITHIRSLDEHNPDQLKELLEIAKTEPDNLVRAIARAKLEGRAIGIIENLLNFIESRKYDFDAIDRDVE